MTVSVIPYRSSIRCPKHSSKSANVWALSGAETGPLEAAGWLILRTSAKTGEGVEEAFVALAAKLL